MSQLKSMKFALSLVLPSKTRKGWKEDGGPGPQLELVSLYVNQFPADDLSVELAQKHGFRLCRSNPEALTLGTDQLAVFGVLSIGVHGDYPYHDKGQHPYTKDSISIPLYVSLMKYATQWKSTSELLPSSKIGIPVPNGLMHIGWRDPPYPSFIEPLMLRFLWVPNCNLVLRLVTPI